MYLTQEEEEMLEGEHGIVTQKSMEILVTLGEVFGAKKLERVTSTHISGISYKNIGTHGLSFLEEWANNGAITRVPSTINPAGMDIEQWSSLGVDQTFAEKQIRIVNAFKKMSTQKSLTCTPYLIGNTPRMGEHMAWAESSAVAFSNSVLGARTNREGGPTALASAITGRTPVFGYHLTEQRAPTHEIHVNTRINGVLEYSTLGYYVGKSLGTCVPLFQGIQAPSLEEMKALSAGLAASGAIALFHIQNVTPEANQAAENQMERVNVDKKSLNNTVENLSTEEEYEHICIGCPHCSIKEIAEIARKIAGKKVKRKLWIFTARIISEEAKRRGYLSIIERAGGKIVSDTCMVVAPMREMGLRGMVVNSCKAAHYVPNTCQIPITMKSLDDCLAIALGR
ncbi:MAG: aconitase X catalytic domain-containing protein [Candidatus Bathyarchaeota archaeon]|nr:MAG: aconitase X catalytic domain-containing protein [Candidatus Bathyarchaeota archaeon]